MSGRARGGNAEGLTVDAVGDEGLAVRVLVLGGGVALVVTDLVTAFTTVGLDLVRLVGEISDGAKGKIVWRRRTRSPYA